ncbi:MAG TPA: winged helix DNA-binding protein [Vineibacter sp.]|nr:winged helix DNA-binding protein [Vineibacter sp.]
MPTAAPQSSSARVLQRNATPKAIDAPRPHRVEDVGSSCVARDATLNRSERIRAMLREHKLRARIFRGSALIDPGWNMLLDLMLAHLEGRQIYLSSLCMASGLPITNGKRRVAQLIADGLVRRDGDHADRRRVLISLTASGLDRLFAYLDQIERDDARWERA